MKHRHLSLRLAQLKVLADASYCPRGQVAAMLIDPERNTILADGYNGPPRGPDALCGGSICERNTMGIASGTRMEIGCHHAEMNVICNAAASGTNTKGAWMLTNVLPCLMCAKLIHHAGVTKVITIANSYKGGEAGIRYLEHVNVPVQQVEHTHEGFSSL